MWSRVISALFAAILGAQLVTVITRRAAAAVPAPAVLLVAVEGPAAGAQIAALAEAASGALVPVESLPRDQRLLSDAITSLARCHAQEGDPECSTADRGWSGRFGVELLAEAHAALPPGDRQARVMIAEAGRRADAALRSTDPDARLHGLGAALDTARGAFALLR